MARVGWNVGRGSVFSQIELIDFTIGTIGEQGRSIGIHFHIGEAGETIDRFHIVHRYAEHAFGFR